MATLDKHTTFRFPAFIMERLDEIVRLQEKNRNPLEWMPKRTRTAILISLIEKQYALEAAKEDALLAAKEKADVKKTKTKSNKKKGAKP